MGRHRPAMMAETHLPDSAQPSLGLFVAPGPTREPVVAPETESRRHLLGLERLGAPAILDLLSAAREWRARWSASRAPVATLAGVEVCNAFFEDSTRTRLSFELAEKRLGATPVHFG